MVREEAHSQLKAKAIALGLMDRLESATLAHEVFMKEKGLQNA